MTGVAEATAAAPAIVVSRVISASPESLFDAWLDPAAVGIWLRPGNAESTDAVIDPRVGGRFTIVMNSATPTIHGGTYQVIDRPRRLVFTWRSTHTGDRDTLVTVDFVARDAADATPSTEVTITHEQLPNETARLMHTDGWSDGLVLLEQFVAEPR
ncbi:MAG TPA: SRPBCC domain-containing protein [Microbacteriaceae bacterium]